jgi:hypothetical protein
LQPKLSLRNNADAVLEIPHKLLISVVVLSLTMPAMLESTEYIIKDREARKLIEECEYLASNIKLIYKQCTGAEKRIELNVPESTEFIDAGWDLGSADQSLIYSIRFKIDGEEPGRIFLKIGLNYIHICSEKNDVFSIRGCGINQIHLKKCATESDLNSDGLIPDFYIELRNF